MVSYTTIKAQVVFEMLFTLIIGQLAIASQLIEYWVVSWEQEIEMTWRKNSWWMRLLEINLPYSGELQQGWRQKLFLAFKSETQEPLSLSILYNSICSHISSSSNQQSSPRCTYLGTKWVFLVSGQKQGFGSDQGAPGNSNGIEYYSSNLIGRHST